MIKGNRAQAAASLSVFFAFMGGGEFVLSGLTIWIVGQKRRRHRSSQQFRFRADGFIIKELMQFNNGQFDNSRGQIDLCRMEAWLHPCKKDFTADVSRHYPKTGVKQASMSSETLVGIQRWEDMYRTAASAREWTCIFR